MCGCFILEMINYLDILLLLLFSRYSYPTLHNPMGCSTPGSSVFHNLPEFAQTHVSFPASGSFLVSWLFPSGGQSIGYKDVYLSHKLPKTRSFLSFTVVSELCTHIFSSITAWITVLTGVYLPACNCVSLAPSEQNSYSSKIEPLILWEKENVLSSDLHRSILIFKMRIYTMTVAPQFSDALTTILKRLQTAKYRRVNADGFIPQIKLVWKLS